MRIAGVVGQFGYRRREQPMQGGRLEHDHETLDRSLKLELRTAMCLGAHDDCGGACVHAGLAGVQHLKGTAENELNQREGAGRDRMHNRGSADPDLTVRVEPDVTPEPRSRTRKADDVHRSCEGECNAENAAAGRRPFKEPFVAIGRATAHMRATLRLDR